MEFGFARVDGQAYPLKIAIEKQEKFRGIFNVEFAPDPCDPEGLNPQLELLSLHSPLLRHPVFSSSLLWVSCGNDLRLFDCRGSIDFELQSL
jgi:hypothetical protein